MKITTTLKTEEEPKMAEKVWITGVKAKEGGKQYLNPDTPIETTQKEADYLVSIGRAKMSTAPKDAAAQADQPEEIIRDNDADIHLAKMNEQAKINQQTNPPGSKPPATADNTQGVNIDEKAKAGTRTTASKGTRKGK